MANTEYVTKDEFDRFKKKYNKLLEILEDCNIKIKPDFDSLQEELDNDDFDFNLDDDQPDETIDGSKDEDQSIEF